MMSITNSIFNMDGAVEGNLVEDKRSEVLLQLALAIQAVAEAVTVDRRNIKVTVAGVVVNQPVEEKQEPEPKAPYFDDVEEED